jgi:hypothetical protein
MFLFQSHTNSFSKISQLPYLARISTDKNPIHSFLRLMIVDENFEITILINMHVLQLKTSGYMSW